MTQVHRFLEGTYPKDENLGHEIESALLKSPRMALIFCRTLVETLLEKAVEAEGLIKLNLSNLQDAFLTCLFAYDINEAFYVERKYGNAQLVIHSVSNTFSIVKWYIEVYGSVDIEIPEYVIAESSKVDLASVIQIIKELEGMKKNFSRSVHTVNQTEFIGTF